MATYRNAILSQGAQGPAVMQAGASTDACVLWFPAQITALAFAFGQQGSSSRDFSSASRSGSTFTFTGISPYGINYGGPTCTLTLSVVTLAAATPGQRVLVDGGGNSWHLANVVSNGTNASIGGVTLPLSSTVAAVVTDTSQALPNYGTKFSLFGTAEDGSVLFLDGQGNPLRTAALSTLATLGPGPGLVQVAAQGPLNYSWSQF